MSNFNENTFNHMTLPFDKYDKTVNKYGVKVG